MRKLIQKSLAFGLQLKGIDGAISQFERRAWGRGALCTANGTNPDADKSMGLFGRWTSTLARSHGQTVADKWNF